MTLNRISVEPNQGWTNGRRSRAETSSQDLIINIDPNDRLGSKTHSPTATKAVVDLHQDARHGFLSVHDFDGGRAGELLLA